MVFAPQLNGPATGILQMASPLSYLRKNQYLMLVGFGILLMFAFVVAPPLQDYLQSKARTSQDPVLLKWKYGRVRRSDLDRMRFHHNVLHNFLDAVRQKTVEKKGVPKVRPLARAQSEGDLIDSMLLAKEAELNGMRVSDQAITTYLEQLSDSVLSKAEFEELLKDSSRISNAELYKRLRTELLAQNMQRLYASALPVPTPADLWKAHDRLAREINTELLALPVSEFTSAVDGEPTQKELNELFEAGKTYAPDENSAEPGFYILPKADFEYVNAEFQTFLDEAKKTVTEAEIKARYESGIKLREFRKEKKPAENPEETNTDPPVGLVPPVDTKPEDKPAEKPEDQPEEKPADEPEDKPADKNLPPLESPGAAFGADESTLFVSTQAEPQDDPKPAPKDDSKPAPKDDAKAAPKDDAKAEPQDDPKAAPKDDPKPAPKDDPKPASKDDAKAAPKDDAKAAPKDDPKAAPKDDPKAAPKDDAKPPVTLGQPDGSQPPADTTPFESEEDSYKTLDEVRDQIVLELARGRAQSKMDEALDGAEREVQAFYRKRIQWEAMQVQVKEGEKGDPAPTMDLEGLAARHGLSYGRTGLQDATTIGETELGKCSRELPAMFGQGSPQTITFAQEAFRGEAKLYEPARASNGDEINYVYWRTAVEEGRVPEMSDVAEQVRAAWGRQQARELARQEAEKLVDLAATKSLKEVAGARAEKVIETGKFTWLTSNLPPGMASFGAQPRLTEVNGVDGAGEEFMKGVFALKKGEATVVTNQSESEVYVVKVIDESTEDELRADFIADVPSTEIQLAYSATNQVFRARMDQLQEDMALVFMGPE